MREVQPTHDESGRLLCPDCGSTLLHHVKIDTYDRVTEDSPRQIHTEFYCGGTPRPHSLPAHNPGNPSTRRGGLVIQFYCEECSGAKKLAFAQHKGETYTSWKDTKKGMDKMRANFLRFERDRALNNQ